MKSIVDQYRREVFGCFMWHILLIEIVLVGILVDVLDVFVIGMVYFLHEMELLVFGMVDLVFSSQRIR